MDYRWQFNPNKSLIEVTGQPSHAPSADGRGFEPLDLVRSLAFETSAIGHLCQPSMMIVYMNQTTQSANIDDPWVS